MDTQKRAQNLPPSQPLLARLPKIPLISIVSLVIGGLATMSIVTFLGRYFSNVNQDDAVCEFLFGHARPWLKALIERNTFFIKTMLVFGFCADRTMFVTAMVVYAAVMIFHMQNPPDLWATTAIFAVSRCILKCIEEWDFSAILSTVTISLYVSLVVAVFYEYKAAFSRFDEE